MVKQRSAPRRTTGILAAGGVAASAIIVFGAASPAAAESEVAAPATFTSAFTVMATPEQVLNTDGEPTPGPAGAAGEFTFRINSDLDIICYDITVTGISGDYQSPAKTATHIHAAAIGEAGPPRLAFPNPAPVGDGPRTSSGCLQGPYWTGILVDDVDTGQGFNLSAIEANPAGFAADTHTVANPAGAVRGQLTAIPVGGVETGGGATAGDAGAPLGAIALGAVALLGTAGLVAYRRRESAA